MIIINITPVWGVWFRHWDARQVFFVYCFESVIAGMYNVLTMTLTAIVKKRDVWENNGSRVMAPGWGFILFFIVHYGFFIFIQLGIFAGVSGMGNDNFSPLGVVDLLLNVRHYLSAGVQWFLLLFIVATGLLVLKNFVLTGEYKTASMGLLMFSPYARIFVQQFCVLLGSFFLRFGGGAIFIVLFVIVKMFFETVLDFDMMLKSALDKAKRPV